VNHIHIAILINGDVVSCLPSVLVWQLRPVVVHAVLMIALTNDHFASLLASRRTSGHARMVSHGTDAGGNQHLASVR
jgi:hypothetical protein